MPPEQGGDKRGGERACALAVFSHGMAVENRRLRSRTARHRNQNRRKGAGRVADRVHAYEERDNQQRVLHRHDEGQHDGQSARSADAREEADETSDQHTEGHKHKCLGLKNAD